MTEEIEEQSKSRFADFYENEDWWACWLGFFIFALAPLVTHHAVRIPKPHKWLDNPLDAFSADMVLPLIILMVGLAYLCSIALAFMKEKAMGFMWSFPLIFLLGLLSLTLDAQKTLDHYGLGYAFWALVFGLLISNTLGTPQWAFPAIRTELYIKIGLVLLGGEVLFSKMIAIGLPGIIVAWVVTPVVTIFMYFFGTRVLRMTAKKLVIIVAAATSVCGVSAAIAVAAACRAKKEQLTLAVGMTLIFTVVMMVGMPVFIQAVGMDTLVGAAWMGGTIDSTGAVVAAGAFLGADAEKVAAVVKMVQNVLIGVVAFIVAILWVTRVEKDPNAPDPSAKEIWIRFPKFVIGFLAASLLFSFFLMPTLGEDGVNDLLKISKGFRGWLFCLAFVSIGLESNFRELASQLVGGKPIVLYAVGQSFNLLLTLLMAWLAFGGILLARPLL
jgi:uncharacterized integral membrane protein (TIGR00698 family)